MPVQQRPIGTTKRHHGTTVYRNKAITGMAGSKAAASHLPPSPVTDINGCPVAGPSLMHPRIAVLLGVPAPWHSPLFACRLLSIAPAVWFAIPPVLRLLLRLQDALYVGLQHRSRGEGEMRRYSGQVEVLLAIIWCGASGYLSFFFTDCLMSRWLLNYTPQATIVRLLAVNALNGYLTSWVLYLAGSSQDDRLLLPAWIAIATILTAIYHTTQRKINIRKETNISISVFSIASFASMLCLLAQLHSDRAQSYPAVPAITFMRQARSIIERIIDMEGRLREGYG
ncbi:hypothetical protein MCOR27_010254 [Pyricularia oryzae]|uniref:N-glycosylation protein EOS1 n=1 Tax=Pyricularia grisea TaxID=148305 RepID=A0ABQ8N6L5_PYRGI|nr:hypothetical protein MCOR01_005171 [Pyricularia oryzae]KAI6292136.1 hypothetical protein MCOR33_010089 [Pyricularia grisea]KAI6253585.1 hypothetical protein MCOR19_009850 [Pyricularia oryzae]KAI6268236.1 hypothetical protein MCOR27_010254 [Pyricularia oryzae]KAI6271263.1 hypothetical protein MCOR26_007859 [Pyricularia oryzae]